MSNSSRVLYNRYQAYPIIEISLNFLVSLWCHQRTEHKSCSQQVKIWVASKGKNVVKEHASFHNTGFMMGERTESQHIWLWNPTFFSWESMNKSPFLLPSFCCEETGTDACVMGIWQSWCDHHLKTFLKCYMGMLEKCCSCTPSYLFTGAWGGRPNRCFFFLIKIVFTYNLD